MRNALFTPKNIWSIMFTALFLVQFTPQATACIDPDSVITRTVNYSPNLDKIEIRLGNLKLHTETPNTFCTCALSSFSDVFTDLQYIAFVNPGTNEPYPNFDVWDANMASSSSWNESYSTSYPEWDGFVGDVINDGLTFNDEVELVIRANLPPGYSLAILDSTFFVSYLGTDEWDAENQEIKNEHTGLRNLGVVSFSSYVERSNEYFDQLDMDLTTSIAEIPAEEKSTLRVFPNPAREYVYVEVPKDFQDMEIIVYNSIGQEVYQNNQPATNNWVLKIPLNNQGRRVINGLYYITILSKNQRLSQTFMLMP